MAVFGPGALANRKLIDDVVADRPVYLTSRDGHSGWANSKALEMAGIDRNTADPASGRIDRDPVSGDPVGVHRDGEQRGAARERVETHLVPLAPVRAPPVPVSDHRPFATSTR